MRFARCAVFAAAVMAFCLTARGRAAQADDAYYFGAVVCEGNRALVRFTMAYNDEQPVFAGVAEGLPITGMLDLDGLQPETPERCFLDDGREVVLRQADLGNVSLYGACGSDTTQLFSLWVGGQAVYRQAVWRDKCDSQPIRAVLLEQGRLTECRAPLLEGGMAHEDTAVACIDRSEFLQPRRDNPLKPGEMSLVRAAPGTDGFCRSLLRVETRPASEIAGDSRVWQRWPTFQRDGIEVLLEADDRRPDRPRLLDLDNSGRMSRAVASRPELGVGPGTAKTVWSLLPADASDAEAEERAALLDRAWDGDAVARLRSSGITIFAGDQTALDGVIGVHLTPFRREGVTWMLAERLWTPTDRNELTGIVLRPSPDGAMQELCAFRSTPPL